MSVQNDFSFLNLAIIQPNHVKQEGTKIKKIFAFNGALPEENQGFWKYENV